MSMVVMHNVVSVDGFIADAEDEVGPLFDWYFNGDSEIVEGRPFKISRASVEYVRSMWASIGSMVIGRHLFAGKLSVVVAAGNVDGQALALGLVDEVAMDVVPVVFGAGKRYFGSVDSQHLLEDPHTVIQGERVRHLRYRVRR